jgi:hypothetical protein
LDGPVKSPKPPQGWKQLIFVIVEITLFLIFWFLLNLGIFSGYFAILLILVLGVVIYFSFHDRHEDE